VCGKKSNVACTKPREVGIDALSGDARPIPLAFLPCGMEIRYAPEFSRGQRALPRQAARRCATVRGKRIAFNSAPRSTISATTNIQTSNAIPTPNKP
jgi:hypothetical protein